MNTFSSNLSMNKHWIQLISTVFICVIASVLMRKFFLPCTSSYESISHFCYLQSHWNCNRNCIYFYSISYFSHFYCILLHSINSHVRTCFTLTHSHSHMCMSFHFETFTSSPPFFCLSFDVHVAVCVSLCNLEKWLLEILFWNFVKMFRKKAATEAWNFVAHLGASQRIQKMTRKSTTTRTFSRNFISTFFMWFKKWNFYEFYLNLLFLIGQFFDGLHPKNVRYEKHSNHRIISIHILFTITSLLLYFRYRKFILFEWKKAYVLSSLFKHDNVLQSKEWNRETKERKQKKTPKTNKRDMQWHERIALIHSSVWTILYKHVYSYETFKCVSVWEKKFLKKIKNERENL